MKTCLREVEMTNWTPFPTVLIVLKDAEVQDHLSCGLQNRGYMVLDAASLGEALEIVRIHSRPIHLLLLGPECRLMAAVFKKFRPYMKILFVTAGSGDTGPDQTNPEVALDAVKAIVSPPALAARGAGR